MIFDIILKFIISARKANEVHYVKLHLNTNKRKHDVLSVEIDKPRKVS